MHKGFATIEETKKHLSRFSFRESKLRQTPWFHTPAIGIGTSHSQSADPFGDSELFQRAVEYALKNGINFIDTALNYRGMKSEREIGRVLNAMVESDKAIERSAIIIATKAGIIPGDIEANLPPAKYLQEVLVKNGVIEEKDVNFAGSHNRHVMTPKYYRFAINKSREHLGVETIDIHYIHNPEISREVLGAERFYRELHDLFACYEDEVARGSIRHYGLATWRAFQVAPGENTYLSLAKIVQIAEEVGGSGHHFRFIQLPYNTNHTNAATNDTQQVGGKWMPALRAIQKLGLCATISAPLDRGQVLAGGRTACEQLNFVIDTPGVLSAMVGTKNTDHLEENIKNILMGK